MKTICRSITVLFSIVLVASCAQMTRIARQPEPEPVPLTAAHFRAKAVAHENHGDLPQALLAWQVAATIKDDPNTRKAIANLKQTMAAEAELHFKSGLASYRSGNLAKARIDFLKTIRVQPKHRGARYYLKTRLHASQQTVYKVRRGDSYSKIAAQIYGDPKKAYLVAYFNNNDPLKPLLAGTTLLLPVLDTRARQSRPSINTWLAKAQKALGKKKYDTALAYTAKIRKELAGHPKALKISDQAHFGKAAAYSAKGRYLEALKHLKKVRPSFSGRNQAIARARQHLLKQALEEKMRLAKTQMDQQTYDNAIHITEEILAQYPNHKQARKIHDEARYALAKQLIDGGEPVAAVEVLEKSDLSYKDTDQLLSLARARVKSQAEKHYRKGVNHFINEDLAHAIEQWRLALELNPEHPKASQDIENAMRLLEKYKTLETKP